MAEIILKKIYFLLLVTFIIVFSVALGANYLFNLYINIPEIIESVFIGFTAVIVAFIFIRKDIKDIKTNDKFK